MGLSRVSSNILKIVSRFDGALGIDIRTEDGKQAYDSYLDSLDESVLQLSGEPTRFCVKTILSRAEEKASTKPFKVRQDQSFELAADQGTDLARVCLVGIENPPDTVDPWNYSKGKDGYADENLISELSQLGILGDVLAARTRHMKPSGDVKKK